MKKLLLFVLIMTSIPIFSQIPIDARYWIAENAYLQPRQGNFGQDAYMMGITGFDKISDNEWKMKEFNECCYQDPGCVFNAKLANEGKAYGMPCFRDHILARYENGDKTTWGKLIVLEAIPNEPPVEIVTDTTYVSKVPFEVKKDTCFTITEQWERVYTIREMIVLDTLKTEIIKK